MAYVHNARRVDNVQNLHTPALLVDGDTNMTVASIDTLSSASGESVLSALKATAIRIPTNLHMYVFDHVMTDEEIIHHWELNGEDARNRGTEAHLQMELWFNAHSDASNEMRPFKPERIDLVKLI